MSTRFSCVHVGKEVFEDRVNAGYSESKLELDGEVNLVSDSLPKLIALIGAEFGLNIESVSLLLVGEDSWLVFRRCEGIDRKEQVSTIANLRAWEKGELRTFCAEYSFRIEKQTFGPLTESDLRDAGIVIAD